MAELDEETKNYVEELLKGIDEFNTDIEDEIPATQEELFDINFIDDSVQSSRRTEEEKTDDDLLQEILPGKEEIDLSEGSEKGTTEGTTEGSAEDSTEISAEISAEISKKKPFIFKIFEPPLGHGKQCFFLKYLYMMEINDHEMRADHKKFIETVTPPPTGMPEKKTALVFFNVHSAIMIDAPAEELFRGKKLFKSKHENEIEFKDPEDLKRYGIRAIIPQGMEVVDMRVSERGSVYGPFIDTRITQYILEKGGRLTEDQLLRYSELVLLQTQYEHRFKFDAVGKRQIPISTYMTVSTGGPHDPIYEYNYSRNLKEEKKYNCNTHSILCVSNTEQPFHLYFQDKPYDVQDDVMVEEGITSSNIFKLLSDKGYEKVIVCNTACAVKRGIYLSRRQKKSVPAYLPPEMLPPEPQRPNYFRQGKSDPALPAFSKYKSPESLDSGRPFVSPKGDRLVPLEETPKVPSKTDGDWVIIKDLSGAKFKYNTKTKEHIQISPGPPLPTPEMRMYHDEDIQENLIRERNRYSKYLSKEVRAANEKLRKEIESKLPVAKIDKAPSTNPNSFTKYRDVPGGKTRKKNNFKPKKISTRKYNRKTRRR